MPYLPKYVNLLKLQMSNFIQPRSKSGLPDFSGVKYTNGHKIYQYFPFQGPPKHTQKRIFGKQTYHLATLEQMPVVKVMTLLCVCPLFEINIFL
jgi:hypothetical protein